MMLLAIERCFEAADVEVMLIDSLASNVRAHACYERLGFRFLERRRFGADDCFVYERERCPHECRCRGGREG